MLKIRSTLIAAVTALLTVTLGISQTAQAQTYNELRKTNWVENCQENGRLEIDWDDRNKISYKWKAGGPVVPLKTTDVYCSVKCPYGTESTHVRNALYMCQEPAQECNGTTDKLPSGWDDRYDQNEHFYPSEDGTVYFGETDCWVKKDYDDGDKVRCMPNWLGNTRRDVDKKCYWFEGGA